MSKLRILLADDHKAMREGLKMLINAQPDMEVISEADDGMKAWQQAQECQPDLVVMDVSMPELNGAKATEKLKQQSASIKVLALTAHEDRSYVSQLLEAGASGYVLKVAAAAELINAIRTVAAGGIYLDPAVAGKVLSNYKQPPKGEARHHALTAREEEVMRLFAEGYTNKEIAARLALSVKTIETHKANAMEKLDLRSRAQVVRYALGEGWLKNTSGQS
ncbi:MAG: response regulator [Pyrinomonadaceae bacterium]